MKKMKDVSVTIRIEASAEKIWKTISSFDRVERYVPIIKSTSVQGSGNGAERTCSVQFGEQKGKIIEKIDSLDDESKTLKFTMVEAPPQFEGVQINMQVKALDETRSEFQVWSMLSYEQAQPIQEIFQMIANGLKKLHEVEV